LSRRPPGEFLKVAASIAALLISIHRDRVAGERRSIGAAVSRQARSSSGARFSELRSYGPRGAGEAVFW